MPETTQYQGEEKEVKEEKVNSEKVVEDLFRWKSKELEASLVYHWDSQSTDLAYAITVIEW